MTLEGNKRGEIVSVSHLLGTITATYHNLSSKAINALISGY